MATLKEQDVVLTSKDANGNPVIQMPITRAGNVEDLTSTCLPLVGGTMTGQIKMAPASAIAKTNTSGNLTVHGGTTYSDGAYVQLYGESSETNPGSFTLAARGGGKACYLAGRTDGTLRWTDREVLTTANGLPLSGGTMTGTIKSSNTTTVIANSDSSNLGFYGGTAWNKGAYALLRGKDSTNSGWIELYTHDGTNTKGLVLKPDGTATWGGNNILTNNYTNAWVIDRDIGHIHKSNANGRMVIRGGTSSGTDGANLQLHGSGYSSEKGVFKLVAHDGTNNKTLLAKPDGTLQWSGNNVVRSVNGTKADASGNVALPNEFDGNGVKTNPITSTANDTPAKWVALGGGTYWFNTNGYLIDQPQQYGFLINFVASSDVFQLFKAQREGQIYYRSGNGQGWANNGSWEPLTGCPNYASTTKTTSFPFTAPSNGVLNIYAYGGSWSYQTYYVNGVECGQKGGKEESGNNFFILSAGDVVTASTDMEETLFFTPYK